MKCPYCGNENTKVIDSRPTEEGAIRRRRQCESCAKRFTTDEIETQIFNSGEKEIPTTKIGMIVMDKLKKLDEVAYVRFASVYREFKDVNTFLEEINKILK